MSEHLITTYEVVSIPETKNLPQVSDLSVVRRQVEFVRRVLANGFLDFDTLDELDEALVKALRAVDEYEGQRAHTAGAAAVRDADSLRGCCFMCGDAIGADASCTCSLVTGRVRLRARDIDEAHARLLALQAMYEREFLRLHLSMRASLDKLRRLRDKRRRAKFRAAR